MPKWCFFFFEFFFFYFLEFSSPGWIGTEFGMKIFFVSFSAYLNSVWIEIMSKWCFLIFLLFSWEFSSSDKVGTEFRTKFFFSLFLILSQLGLDRNMAGMIFFFFFLKFFAIFFRIFLLGSGRNGIRDENFSLSFLAYLDSV